MKQIVYLLIEVCTDSCFSETGLPGFLKSCSLRCAAATAAKLYFPFGQYFQVMTAVFGVCGSELFECVCLELFLLWKNTKTNGEQINLRPSPLVVAKKKSFKLKWAQ